MPTIKPISDLYEEKQAEFKLLSELLKAEESVKENGWVSEEEADALIAEI